MKETCKKKTRKKRSLDTEAETLFLFLFRATKSTRSTVGTRITFVVFDSSFPLTRFEGRPRCAVSVFSCSCVSAQGSELRPLRLNHTRLYIKGTRGHIAHRGLRVFTLPAEIIYARRIGA